MIDKNTVIRFIIAIAFLVVLYYAGKTMCFEVCEAMRNDVTYERECEYVSTKKSVINIIDNTPKYKNLGVFMLTAYCPCEKCCGKTDGITSTGTKATHGRTIAVDPDIIPYGTKVLINGSEYVAEDCGGAINNNHIDVFFNTHEEALEFGVRYENIYVMED